MTSLSLRSTTTGLPARLCFARASLTARSYASLISTEYLANRSTDEELFVIRSLSVAIVLIGYLFGWLQMLYKRSKVGSNANIFANLHVDPRNTRNQPI